MAGRQLAGRSILLLEDELLIAMDVEQTCLDHGAEKVAIFRSLEELGASPFEQHQFDCGIIDLHLGARSTTGFAEELRARSIPFVFATGFSDFKALVAKFPDVSIVSKPYSSEDLVMSLVAAIVSVELSRSA